MLLKIIIVIVGILIGYFLSNQSSLLFKRKRVRLDIYGNDIIPSLGSGNMFDTIAPYYDIANKVMSLGFDNYWRNIMINELDLSSNSCNRIIDIATGTGDIAIKITKKLKLAYQLYGLECEKPYVYGLDPSIEMLSYASDKMKYYNYTNDIQFIHGDATRMPKLGRSSFHQATMSFGIRNIQNRIGAIKEIRRIIKKNGKFIVMEFVEPTKSLLAPVAKFFIKYIIPIMGSMFSFGHDEEYKHLSDSIFNFPSPSEFSLELEQAGFKSCTYQDIFQDVVYIWICNK